MRNKWHFVEALLGEPRVLRAIVGLLAALLLALGLDVQPLLGKLCGSLSSSPPPLVWAAP
jgi:hypothetical protein